MTPALGLFRIKKTAVDMPDVIVTAGFDSQCTKEMPDGLGLGQITGEEKQTTGWTVRGWPSKNG